MKKFLIAPLALLLSMQLQAAESQTLFQPDIDDNAACPMQSVDPKELAELEALIKELEGTDLAQNTTPEFKVEEITMEPGQTFAQQAISISVPERIESAEPTQNTASAETVSTDSIATQAKPADLVEKPTDSLTIEEDSLVTDVI